jgi:hypothetical protein
MLFIHEGNKDGEAKDRLAQKVIEEVVSWQKQQHRFNPSPRIQVRETEEMERRKEKGRKVKRRGNVSSR